MTSCDDGVKEQTMCVAPNGTEYSPSLEKPTFLFLLISFLIGFAYAQIIAFPVVVSQWFWGKEKRD